MSYTENQTRSFGSFSMTDLRAAATGQYFKIATGEMSPAAKAAKSHQKQQQLLRCSWMNFEPTFSSQNSLKLKPI